MKKLLLTGGNGFIGKHLLRGLNKNYKVLAPSSHQLNVADCEQLIDYINTNNISLIVHTATYNKRDTNPSIELDVNLRMFCNLEIASSKVEKVLYFGSGAEYDKRFPIQMVKEQFIGVHVPNNAYGFSKYIANTIAKTSRNIYNLRLFGVFGPFEDWENCFISNICAKTMLDLPISIRQDCAFDYLFVEDLISIVEWFLENTPNYHDYNIVTGKPIYLTEIVRQVLTIANKNLPITILRPGENLSYTASNYRLTQEYTPFFTPIDKAIQKLYVWYQENKENINYDVLKNSR